MQVNWIASEPRQGLAGWLDRMAGPGATHAEVLLQFLHTQVLRSQHLRMHWLCQ